MLLIYIDVDECQQSGRCDHDCVNVEGGYRCSCRALYTLSDNRHSCDGTTSFVSVAATSGGIVIVLLLVIIFGACFFRYVSRRKQQQASDPTGPNSIPNPL